MNGPWPVCIPPLAHLEILTTWGIVAVFSIIGGFLLGWHICKRRETVYLRFIAEQLKINADPLRSAVEANQPKEK